MHHGKVWCDSVDIALIHGKVRWNTDKINIYNGFPDSDWLHFLIRRGMYIIFKFFSFTVQKNSIGTSIKLT